MHADRHADPSCHHWKRTGHQPENMSTSWCMSVFLSSVWSAYHHSCCMLWCVCVCVSVCICLRACDCGPVPLLLATVPQEFSRQCAEKFGAPEDCHVFSYQTNNWYRFIPKTFLDILRVLVCSSPLLTQTVAADSCVKQRRNFWHWLGVTRQCKQMSSSLLWEKQHPWPCHG